MAQITQAQCRSTPCVSSLATVARSQRAGVLFHRGHSGSATLTHGLAHLDCCLAELLTARVCGVAQRTSRRSGAGVGPASLRSLTASVLPLYTMMHCPGIVLGSVDGEV
jgi:hypothetical protein